uniref:cytochrome c oxidase subunit III n=1 Tax=Rhotana formosana TaxID=3081105 RepID=UPI002A833EA8|nr:cytochrome c oxidase subunit III [Rhotana formosana]WOW99131.1 cytochrome c oxidase subunit III [Rhotana formosana]
MTQNHPFHMVTKSPWPFLTSINLFMMLIMSASYMNNKFSLNLVLSSLLTIMCMMTWWNNIIKESTFQGNHTTSVTNMLKTGMLLFIVSEIMFFVSFFWMFFHSSLTPSVEIGMKWPPKSIKPFNPIEIPLLNTIILLASGASLTWSHQMLMMNKMNKSILTMMMTILLGIYFTILQKWEYTESQFTISDSIFGSAFFIMTGFHGIHVIVGTTLLIISTLRMMNIHLSSYHHMGYEASAWYWHFVDVVWLFLYISVYWWGK